MRTLYNHLHINGIHMFSCSGLKLDLKDVVTEFKVHFLLADIQMQCFYDGFE